MISHVEVRSEDDEDIAQYTNHKELEIIKCGSGGSVMNSSHGSRSNQGSEQEIRNLFGNIMKTGIAALGSVQLLTCENPNYLNSLALEECPQ